jgi:hypothetical protein
MQLFWLYKKTKNNLTMIKKETRNFRYGFANCYKDAKETIVFLRHHHSHRP